MTHISTIVHLLVELAAPRLLGCVLKRRINGNELLATIVETEAYHQSDEASHSYKGRTNRTDIMFGNPGNLYVYFTYGLHYCCNVVVSPEGIGAAVLIRAVEPMLGIDTMKNLRNCKDDISLTNGFVKLCQALQISKDLNGHNLQEEPLQLLIQDPVDDSMVVQTTRIGITKAKDKQWRFYIKNNPYVSRV